MSKIVLNCTESSPCISLKISTEHSLSIFPCVNLISPSHQYDNAINKICQSLFIYVILNLSKEGSIFQRLDKLFPRESVVKNTYYCHKAIWGQFQALRLQPMVFSNSSYRGTNAVIWPLLAPGTYILHTYIHASKTLVSIKYK